METNMNGDFNRPIFILGAPRSGLSLVAGSLNICGAWSEDTSTATAANPEGVFNDRGLQNLIIKPILEKLNSDPLGVKDLPILESLQEIPNLKDVIFNIISNEGYIDDTPWIFKETRLTLIWPILMFAFPDARWIIGRRETADIVRSCLKTDATQQRLSDPAIWKTRTENYLKRLELLKINMTSYNEIWPHRLTSDSLAPLESLVTELGLTWKADDVSSYIDKKSQA